MLTEGRSGSIADEYARAVAAARGLRQADEPRTFSGPHDAFAVRILGALNPTLRAASDRLTATSLAAEYRIGVGAMNDRMLQHLGILRAARATDVARSYEEANGARLATTGASARALKWANGLSAHGDSELSSALGLRSVGDELGRLSRDARSVLTAGNRHAGDTAGVLRGDLAMTALRMSALGGALDMMGPNTAVGNAAFGALLGSWSTREDLPAAFWRDRGTRSRMYHDADVDEGLIEADGADVVEVLVESGVVEGVRTRGGVKAVVEVGPLRMSITTRRARHGAYSVIDAFEVALRAFIGLKLEAHVEATGGDPAKWFELRVPGNIVGAAKETRRAAYVAGEERQPLINFTNLGDLIAVVTSNRNWAEVFGDVFGDREAYKVDLARLNAHRRPIMHARPIDGLRLAEIVLTTRRLLALMQADGLPRPEWDDDI